MSSRHHVREEEEETKKKHATKKTKLEYTIANCRENPQRYSPYVREFLRSNACAEMRENVLFDSWMRKSSLVKEIEEATACLKQIERVLMKKKKRGVLIEEEEALRSNGGEGLTFVDLCSGKGFLSIVLSFAFPNARVEMMDRDESANVEHVEAMKNVTFRRVDVTSEECEKIVEDAANTSKFVFICGVHLCGDLSRVAIRLWRNVRRRMDGQAAIVLSPCCLPQRRRHDAFGFHVKDQARALKVDNYRLWCIFLSLEMRRCLMEDGGGGREARAHPHDGSQVGSRRPRTRPRAFRKPCRCPHVPPHRTAPCRLVRTTECQGETGGVGREDGGPREAERLGV